MGMGMTDTLRLGMAQVNLLVGDIEGNTRKVLEFAHQAQQQNLQLVAFPELTLTGYPPEDLLLRSGLYARVEHALQTLCAEIGNIGVIIGYPRQIDGKAYNMAGLIRNGRIEVEYSKQALPNYSVFDEKRYFTAGVDACVFEYNGIPLGITICEDIWESQPMQQAVQAGARLMINLNASPFQIGKGRERERVLRRRIEENAIPIVYVNLLGGQDELVFDGDSLVMDRHGKIAARAPAFAEGLYTLDCVLSEDGVDISNADYAPVMTDVESAYHALVMGVRDYVNKNGFNGVVIGLSGGVDSALTLAIAVDALGAERVEGVSMPSRYTMDMSIEDAQEEAHNLGIEFQVIPIEPVFEAFLESLKHEFEGKPVDTTEENIQARCRAVMLMAISNKKGKMVLTTGNKSEMSVGYATLYGDMAGGFCVLKDVPKTLVYQLCQYRNQEQIVIPERVIERPPSAELAPDQKDEDSLPPYDILDVILERYVERDQCAEVIISAGFDAETVYKVIRLVDRNEYKRRQAAPGIKITHRAFGRDRRYPITSGFGRYAPE
jgi:NAD+ synthase (glutamine-hydrolysing)